jgi:hypothetical protein
LIPRPARHLRGLILVAGLLILLAGCSGPVEVPPPTPSEDAAGICRSLIATLPETVDGHDRRETDPASDYTAAWGDPAIILACGVTKPPGLGPASQCFEVNGVGWFAEQQEQRVRFTTIGREAFVQVIVPKDHAPEANPLVDLAAPITRQIPVVDACV